MFGLEGPALFGSVQIPAFRLVNVVPTGLATLRVTYSIPPLAQLPAGTTDALNPDNYHLTGPLADYVASVESVVGDPNSVDCFLTAPLTPGAWKLEVDEVVDSNDIETVSSSPFPFAVASIKSQTSLVAGAQNDAVENVLRKFFNPGLTGTNWDAILAAIAAGDRTNWDNAKLAFDQLYLPSASGSYLDSRATDEGVRRPIDVGMVDAAFRRLAIAVKNRKLTQEAILEVLEIFYGQDAVRASSTSGLTEPFDLTDQDVLQVLLDERTSYSIPFERGHFTRISSASAIEVAASLTNGLQDQGATAYALAYQDPVTGLGRVRIYSGSLGLTSSVRIVGGRAQRKLQFPTPVFDESDFAHPLVVQLAATGPLTPTSTGGGPGAGFHLNFSSSLIVDGTALVGGVEGVGTRVLLTTQVDARQNGIFHCGENDLGGHTLYRDSDFWANSEIVTGQVVEVTSGTVNTGAHFQLTSESIGIDVLPLDFVLGTPLPAPTMTPTTWLVSASPDHAGYLRFSGGTSFDLDLVLVGDLAYVFADEDDDEFLAAGLQGVFPVSSVVTYYDVESPGSSRQQWFEVYAPDLVNIDTVVTQNDFDSLMFFRPTKRTTHDVPGSVVVRRRGTVTNVVVPATTSAVVRGPGQAAYLNTADSIQIASLTRRGGGSVSVTTSTPHGLTVGEQFIVDEASPIGQAAVVDAGSISGAYSGGVATGTTNGSVETVVSESDTFEGTEHRVLRLREGEVLVVGGQTQVDPSTTTALPHPAVFEILSESASPSGGRAQNYKWTLQTGLTIASGRRSFGTSVLSGSLTSVDDDRVLLTGGTDGDDVTGTSKNNWDLITYSKSPALNAISSSVMPVARAGHAQANLPTSYQLVCGGWTVAGTPIASSYSFDPSTFSWTARGSMVRARWRHQLTPFALNSSILALASGGRSATAVLNSCEIYSVGTTTWRATGSMSVARYDHASIPLPNGRILVVGGTGYNPTQSATPAPLSSCEIYDPSTELWQTISPTSVARTLPVAAYLPTLGAVLVTGGGSTVVELLDLETMTWSRSLAVLPLGLAASAGALVAADTVLVAGGLSGTASTPKSFTITPGAEVRWSGGVNRRAIVSTAPSPTTLTFDTEDYQFGDDHLVAGPGATVVPSAARGAPSGVPGPFVLDPAAGLTLTSVNEVLAQGLNRGQKYASIALDTGGDSTPALSFPDSPGWIVFNFGTTVQIGPVRYLGRLGTTQLLLDASFTFPTTAPSGATVTLLSSSTPLSTAPAPDVGLFYAISSAAGRAAAQSSVESISGAGLDVEVIVEYPGDRGLGAEGFPTRGAQKVSDSVAVWASNEVDAEVTAAHEASS